MSTIQEQAGEAIDDQGHSAHQEAVVVEQLMTTAPVFVQPETPVPEVIRLIYTKPFHHLLVVDEHNSLVGVISDRDVVRCFCQGSDANGPGMAKMTAADIMSADPLTITPDTSLKEAVGLMRDRGISCLPVLTGSKLAGILTDSDLWTLLHSLLGVMEDRHART
jgi:acetoin utilization protein AcuB